MGKSVKFQVTEEALYKTIVAIDGMSNPHKGIIYDITVDQEDGKLFVYVAEEDYRETGTTAG